MGSAYDPVQGLLALATDEGEIHVFGQQQVEVIMKTVYAAPIRHLRFVKGVYLVAIDEKSNVLVFSIYQKTLLSQFTPPGKVTAFETDPSLDWLLLGLQNGSVYAYDIDRGQLTKFRLDSLQRKVLPRERESAVISIQWNPRDIGSVLIAYTNVALVYALATDEIRASFHYEVPSGAPGGDGLPSQTSKYPKITHAVYHPNSLAVVTAHDDGSLVFWDSVTGHLIHARSLFDIDVNIPQPAAHKISHGPANTQFLKLAWLCHADPDDTSLLIAGGDTPENEGIHNLTLFHFGVAPKYSLTSYEKMAKVYSQPLQQRFLPIQNASSVIDFVPIGTRTPFFSGGHNPTHIFVLLESGEVENITFPTGALDYKSSHFPQSVSWIHPRTTVSAAFPVPKKQWLGMISRTTKNENILKGGFPVHKPLKITEVRNAIATGHANGSVRLYDAAHDELEASTVLEVNVASTLNLFEGAAVDQISYGGETGELAVATVAGYIALYKFDINRNYNPNMTDLEKSMNRLSLNSEKKLLIDLRGRAPNIKEGFMPVCAVHAQKGRVTALKNSNVGFVAFAYESGDLMVLDRRGPAIIHAESIRQKSAAGSTKVTALEFSIMSFGGDGYSSILLYAGTDKGELYTYKILPEASGRFSAMLIDVVNSTDTGVIDIMPYKMENGTPAIATHDQLMKLSDGLIIEGAVIVSGQKDIRIIIPGKAKSSHKLFNAYVLAAGLSVVTTKTTYKTYASAVPVLLSNNTIKILSLPELKDITSFTLPFPLEPRFSHFSTVLPSGEILIRMTESRAAVVNISGTGVNFDQVPSDRLYNERCKMPYRPQIGTAQWLKGTTLINYNDLDRLIGGDRRPPAKSKESQLASGNVTTESKGAEEDEFAYKKPVRGRTVGGYDPTRSIVRGFQNGVESMEETFNEYANQASQSMNESIGDVKKDLVKSVIRSKFGF